MIEVPYNSSWKTENSEDCKQKNYFIDNLRKKINCVSLLNINKDVQIEYSKFGKEAGVIGGASYLLMEYFKESKI